MSVVRVVQEAVVLLLVVLTPWAFGADEPIFRLAVLIGIAALAVLGAARIVAARRIDWHDGPVAFALGGLILLTAFQLVPLPPSVLAVVAPGSLRLRQETLPTTAEQFSAPADPIEAPPGHRFPISLYPEATRGLLVELLAVFLLFVVVRHQVATPASLRRLAWACLGNGSLLALVALMQALSPRPDHIYGLVPTDASPFGPFVNRNHFPFFLHACIGLAFGLFPVAMTRRRNGWEPAPSSFDFLQSPRKLWIVLALALMVTASVYSRSRGGFVSMAAATVLTMIATRGRGLASGAGLAAAGALAGTVALALWLGVGPLLNRFGTIADPRAWEVSRMQLWRSLAKQVPASPVVGSGGGTCEFVEPMHRPGTRVGDLFANEFAHNEYLEALVEGGAVRLLLTLVLVAAVLASAARWLRANPNHPDRGLMLGGLWALAAVAIHAGFEFGPHIPAIAVLITVVAAHLRSMVAPSRPATRHPLAIVAAVGGLTVLAVVLVVEGWTAVRVERYARAALKLARSDDARSHQQRVEFWEAAVRLQPEDATLHQALGQAYLDTGRPELALRHLIAARNRCPILAHPHLRIGENRSVLASGDAAIAYLDRARRLQPSEPDAWYVVGRQHLNDGRPAEAWIAWRRYLEMSDRRLPAIRDAVRPYAAADADAQRLLDDVERALRARPS